MRKKELESLYRRWTTAAKDCYRRRMRCGGCELNWFCPNQEKNNPLHLTPMKYSVLRLIRKLGTPPDERKYDISDLCF